MQPTSDHLSSIQRSDVELRYYIDRPVLTQQDLYLLSEYQSEKPSLTRREQCRAVGRTIASFLLPRFLFHPEEYEDETKPNCKVRCGRFCKSFGTWLLTFLPFITILRKYQWKVWLLNDFIAGLTVGIMQVPQGMAYALLATLPPVYGLYTSFFPPMVYFFFGTSRHISVGTIAVVSLLTGDFLEKKVRSEMQNFVKNASGNDTLAMSQQIVEDSEWSTDIRVRCAPALALAVGLTQFFMGLLQLGSVTRYLSGPMVSGYTVGVACHVLTSQVATILGVQIHKPSGIFALPKTYYEVFKAFTTANLVTIGLSAACITILAIVKNWVNPHVVKKIKIPIPIDLIVVILATVTSHFLELNAKHSVKVVGSVPKGIPPPKGPDLSLVGDSISDIIVIAIVSYSVNISLTRIFSKRFDYEIDSNQELFAFGFTNSISSCFHAFPSAASLSRSAVQVAAGGKTEVTTVFSSILLLFVLFFIGPLFYSVPNCCLSAIIVVALKGMFIHALELKTLWKYSVWDFGTWIFTCVCTVLLDVTFGLLAGVAFSILTIILRTQCPNIRILGRADDTEFYRDVRRNDLAKESDTIKVVRYEGSIYYASAENFRQLVFQKSGMDPAKIFAKLQKVRAKLNKLAKQGEVEQTKFAPAVMDSIGGVRKSEEDKFNPPVEPVSPEPLHDPYQKLSNKLCALQNRCTLQHLILDCSCWNFIDFVGAEELQQLVNDYQKLGVTVSLCAMSDSLIQLLLRNEKLTAEVPLYPSIHDAMLKCQNQLVDKSEHQQNLQKFLVQNISNVGVPMPDCDDQTDSINEDEPGPNFQSGICR
ncbi:hypothetical protein CRM22_005456 [Opisthorchis felineus]|uniref:STAS domain-containing protein n=1 Tax=Opisthorchis felineus TaxID=147828 RepID=A0A4S2LWU8_OPIFE|nr:hypothetical protein CRM22_005456 [Opisthorchis felineus]TGZ66190.1 hypothetical protein CRM22_005456 [Opisthorchis felineus]